MLFYIKHCNKYHLKILMTFMFFLPSEVTLGRISMGISGFGSTSNAGLEKYRSLSGSANLSIGLGQHFRIGLTHRRAFEEKDGLKKARVGTVTEYLPFEDHTISTTNSFDFTVVLYSGKVSPFVFGGVARRDYDTTVKFRNETVKNKFALFPVPTYGFGVAFFVSRDFNFKITQTFSPGIRTILQGNEEKDIVVKDSYTQAGISYNI